MRKQNYPSKTLRHLKQWCWQLVDLNLSNHLVDTAPALFANTKPTHHRCQCFIPGFWRRIHESLSIHQWLSRICNLNAIIEYLNHWTGTGNKESLMNKGIGHQLSYCKLGKHRDCFTQSFFNDFIDRQEPVDIGDKSFETVGVTFCTDVPAKPITATEGSTVLSGQNYRFNSDHDTC